MSSDVKRDRSQGEGGRSKQDGTWETREIKDNRVGRFNGKLGKNKNKSVRNIELNRRERKLLGGGENNC